MISSAVVIPEERVPARPSSPTLKRRQSSLSPGSNKKPRLDTRGNIGDENYNREVQSVAVSSPTQRKSSAIGVGATEERKRGQRLFGALLGTLSQTSSKPIHKRRDEIEQRQRERVKKNNEERAEEAKRKREMLDSSRKVEQKAWDRESAILHHHNLRATSNFLQTKAEPRLYYRPWELRPDEEERIRCQIDKVEELIRKENGEETSSNPGQATTTISLPEEDMNGTLRMAKEPQKSPDRDESSNNSDELPTNECPNTESPAPAEFKDDTRDQPKDEDQGGEELVEGQEDDVMY